MLYRSKQSAGHWLAAQTNRVLKQLSNDVIHLNLPEGVLICKERRAQRMGEERTEGSGSLALADDLNAKPLSERKRVLDEESMLNVFKNAASDQQFNLEAAIKNVDKMSSELKKLNGNSEFIVQLNKKLFKASF